VSAIRIRLEGDLDRHVKVTPGRHEGEDTTIVRIDHCIGGRHGTIRFTTEPQFVSSAHFGARAEEIRRAAGKPGGTGPAARRSRKGRVIYAIHPKLRSGVLCALAYHLPEDPKRPPLVRAIALRENESKICADWSFALAIYLKLLAHAISRKTGRGGRLEAEPNTLMEQAFYERFNFERAPARGGRAVFRQDPL